MVKHFYSFVVETETLFMEIDSLEISDNEKTHLKSLAESHIHSSVLDTILSELSPDNKRTFLSHINSKEHERTWKFVNTLIENAEEKIAAVANKVKKDLLEDLKSVKTS